MSEVVRSSRFRNGVIVLVASMFVLTCAMPDRGTVPAPIAPNVCAGGVGSAVRDRPIVCVDDSSDRLSVHPDPVYVHDVVSSDRATPGAINWFTRSGRGDLQIRFRDESCVKNVVCRGGHCTAVSARKLGETGQQHRCKYDVLLTGHPTLDPETVLVGCCT